MSLDVESGYETLKIFTSLDFVCAPRVKLASKSGSFPIKATALLFVKAAEKTPARKAPSVSLKEMFETFN